MNDTTILVVEDEPLVGLEIQDGLIGLGYQVPVVVTRGEDVQGAILRHRPDLVVMDIRLQGTMDGIQAAELFRKSSDVPLLFLTAYSDSETLGRAAQVLPDGYLLKPFGERDLAASVELALHKAKAPLQSQKNLARMIPLIDSVNQGLALYDRRGRWFHGNPSACQILGAVSPQEGPHLADFLAITPGEFEADPIFWMAQGFPTVRWEANQSLLVEPLTDFGGKPGGFLVTLQGQAGLDTDRASSLQTINQTLLGLLPRNGQFSPRIDNAGFLIPCGDGSGDFYDLFPLGPHHFVFYNLDVEGHGPVPAMMVYSLRSAIRDLAGTYLAWHDEIPAPSVLLDALNEKFDRRDSGSLFFTISLGIVSPVTGEFELVRAGHTRTLWVGADGSEEWLQGEGAALGAFPEVSFEVLTGRLHTGDRLILCSDGLLETLGHRDLEDGYTALADLMSQCRGQSIQEMVHCVKRACLGAHGDHGDDVSLLALGPRLW